MPLLPNKATHRTARIFPLTIGLLVVAASVLAVLNRQSLEDWWKLRGYQPPADVARLASQDTMNSYTRHLFYLNKPQLLGTVTSFRRHCPENKNTIVLGCYHQGQNGIFIYNVSDPALAGVQQVTAAHEVLHSVYARLNSKDRAQLDSELENFYKHDLHNQRIQSEIKLYQKTEPHDVMDEMSCTFGTEVAKLPAPLEAYYKRFFTNRAAIVAYEQRYEAAFTSRQNTIKSDDAQLATMKAQIDSQEAALTALLKKIDVDQNRLDSLLATGQNAAYNAAVPGYNSEIDTYNAGVEGLHSSINSYNQLVDTRNQVSGQLTTLAGAIDTRLTTKSTK